MNIIELAKEAGWTESTWEGFLTKFAALVRAEALEEAAKVCESKQSYNAMHANTEFAAAIRARGEK